MFIIGKKSIKEIIFFIKYTMPDKSLFQFFKSATFDVFE